MLVTAQRPLSFTCKAELESQLLVRDCKLVQQLCNLRFRHHVSVPAFLKESLNILQIVLYLFQLVHFFWVVLGLGF